MEFHPIADIFPLLEGEAFDALCRDVEEKGLMEPIWLYDDKILDGRNRWRACKETGTEPRYRQYEGTDPVGFVVSLNVQRRHLDESQRAMIAARLATMRQGERTDLSPIGERSQADTADLLSVGKRTVERATKVLEEGTPELIAAVDSGEIKVSAAAVLADLPKTSQNATLEGLKAIADGRVTAKQARAAVDAVNGVSLNAIPPSKPPPPPAPPVPEGFWNLIYADPPWQYDFSVDSADAIENHYPTMGVEEIEALPVAGIAADDCVLFLWATSPKLPEALSVLGAWGFRYVTSMVWFKSGLGMGYYSRINHELLLIGVKGTPGAPLPENRPVSVVEAKKGKHSAKPEAFREIIEGMYPAAKRIELFRRGAALPGWDVWGNEAE